MTAFIAASLVSLTRWDRFSRGPTIFNPDTGRVIALEDYPNYSVVIPLAPDNPSATSNQVFISRRVSGPGEFTVEAPPGYGVMAVIQALDLRIADDACNDFIMVRLNSKIIYATAKKPTSRRHIAIAIHYQSLSPPTLIKLYLFY